MNEAVVREFSDPIEFTPGGIFSRGHSPVHAFLEDWAKSFDTHAFLNLNRRPAPAPTTEEIHRSLDERADGLVAAAERVIAYRTKYPMNAFLTRDQVRALCRKYNLVMAPEFMFAGDVPEKNREEREAFRVRNEDKAGGISSDDIFVAMRSSSISTSWYDFEYQVKLNMPGSFSGPWLAAINPEFSLYCPQGIKGLCHSVGTLSTDDPGRPIPIVRNKVGYYRFDTRTISYLQIEFNEIESIFPRNSRFSKVISLEFTFNAYRSADLYQYVVCPANLLHQNMPIRIGDGWEAFPGEGPSRQGAGFDPIILQPVQGGYLVVTKWDAEALLPEVAGQTN